MCNSMNHSHNNTGRVVMIMPWKCWSTWWSTHWPTVTGQSTNALTDSYCENTCHALAYASVTTRWSPLGWQAELTVNRCIDQLLLSEYMSCIDRWTGYTLVTCWQQWCCFASVVNASADALIASQLACWLTQQCFFARLHDLLVTCWQMGSRIRWWD